MASHQCYNETTLNKKTLFEDLLDLKLALLPGAAQDKIPSLRPSPQQYYMLVSVYNR